MWDVRMTGIDGVEHKLAAIPGKMGKTIVRKAVRNSRKPVLNELKMRATRLEKVGTGMAEMIAASLMVRMYKQKTLRKWGIKSGSGAYVGFNTKKYPQLVYNNAKVRTATLLQSKPKREGMKGSGDKDSGRAFIPFCIEFGHASPGNAGGSKTVPPRPFMRIAWAITRQLTIDVATKDIVKGIKKYWATGAKP